MSKPKERSEVEFLRSENRRLKSENRHLKKLLGKSDKKVKAYEDHVDMSEEAETVEPLETRGMICPAPNCQGTLTRVDLGARLLITCSDCSIRKTIKK
jgi:hypothetical protein